LPFAICHLLFAICYLPFAVRYLLALLIKQNAHRSSLVNA
jgi:hypothetical protein